MSHTPKSPDEGYTTGFYIGKDAGIAQEQARIIKLLLEHPLCVDIDYITYCDCSEEATEMDYKDHLLALIKGETE